MIKIKKLLPKLLLFLLLILPAIVLQIFNQTEQILILTRKVQDNLPYYLTTIFLLKTFSIVYPPSPGAVFTISSIPIVGWELAYVVDILGSLFGASLSYALGHLFSEQLLKKILGEKILIKIKQLKLKTQNQFEAAVIIRIASGGILSDGLAWGASLIGFRYLPFITGYGISHLITTLPIFYLLGLSISFNSWAVIALAMLLSWGLILKLKGRYFE